MNDNGERAPVFMAFSGFVIAIVLLVVYATQWSQTRGSSTFEWFVLGAIAPISLIALTTYVLAASRLPTYVRNATIVARIALASIYLTAGAQLALQSHRLLFFGIAAAQVGLIWSLTRKKRERLGVSTIALLFVSSVSWVMTAGLTYVAPSSLLMNAARSSSTFAVAFVAALVLAISDICAEDFDTFAAAAFDRRRVAMLLTIGVILIYLEFSLRTDGLWTDWIPYHRSYFTGIATFVRQGHWLLWDVPSQYGFLSIVTLAITPGRTTWESSYLLTAVFLTAQATMLFVMLRAGRSGFVNLGFAALAGGSVFLSDQADRWPFGPRVYPQHGLRFVWVYALLFVVFWLYAKRTNPIALRRLYALGYAAWCIGVLWAFESAVWCTLVWGGFLLATCAIEAASGRTLGAIGRPFLKLAAFPALLAAAIGAVDFFYLVRLGRVPDWNGYFEFSAIYLGPQIASEKTDLFGPAWLLLIVIGAVGSSAAIAVAARRWTVLPYIAALWAAAWGTSVYFAGEPFSNHVNALVGIFAFAAATLAYIAAAEQIDLGAMWLVRVSFVPMFVLLIATWLGDSNSLAHLRVPFVPGYHFDVTADVAPISGELADLMHRANVTSADKIILPDNVGWTKIDQGLIVPLMRDPNGHIGEVTAWLPMGPAGPDNTSDTLPLARREVYYKRFIDISKSGGWYLTYHEKADCRVLTHRAYQRERFVSKNYAMTLCGIRSSLTSVARSDG